jgi:neutral ceramidase
MFKPMILSAILARVLLFALGVSGIAAAAEFRAGAGKSDIQTTSDMWPVDGFTSQHDPLAVRVLLMDDSRTRAAIVVIDQTSISEGSIAKVKALLTNLTGISAENTIVAASHTFSAPHVFGGPLPGGGNGGPGGPTGSHAPQSPGTVAFARAIDTAVETATSQAKNSMQPAKVGFGLGTSDVSVNRDVPTPLGWWLGGDAAGFSDRSLPVVRIDSIDGKPLAVLINEAVQSSVMDHSENANGTKPITADIAGAATRFVEQQYGGGTVAIFLIGAAGDQAPIFQGNRYVLNRDGSTSRVDIHEAGFTLVDLIGERLGSETLQVSEAIKATASPTIQVWRRTVKVPSQAGSKGLPTEPVLSFSYQPGPEIDVPVVLMRIGDIVLVGLQAELAASVGAQLKANSPFPHTIVVTMVDGGAKYMPDAKSYERFTYEARNSKYARGAAEQTASGIDRLLNEMKQSSDVHLGRVSLDF